MDLAGDPFMMDSLKQKRRKTNMGGTAFPVAFTAQATVTRSPLSADVTEPTCFFPFSVTTCLGVCRHTGFIHNIYHVWWEAVPVMR